MGQTALVTEQVDAGDWIVAAADKAGVPLRAALWLLDGEQDSWRLILDANSDVERGPREFAQGLVDGFGMIENKEQREAAQDILLMSSALSTQPHPAAELLRASGLGKARSVTHARMTVIGGQLLEGALLYRLESPQAH